MHLVAMFSVGVLSALIGGRAIWSVPATFVIGVIGGGILGLAAVPLPFTEHGIALLAVALGLAVALDRKTPRLTLFGPVVIFGAFHGHAHGMELPSDAPHLRLRSASRSRPRDFI